MYRTWIKFALISLALIAVQVWVLSPWALFRLGTPYIYPFLLLLLPIGLRQIPLVVFGFSIGFVLDLLYPTPGLHASVMTSTAFLRHYFVRSMVDREVDLEAPALYRELRGGAVVLLIEILVCHHLLLFFLDGGWASDLGYTLLRLGSSLLLSLALCLVMLMLSNISLRPRSQYAKR